MYLDVRTGVGTNALNGCRARAALVDPDLLEHTVLINGAFQNAPGGSAVSLGELRIVVAVALRIRVLIADN